MAPLFVASGGSRSVSSTPPDWCERVGENFELPVADGRRPNFPCNRRPPRSRAISTQHHPAGRCASNASHAVKRRTCWGTQRWPLNRQTPRNRPRPPERRECAHTRGGRWERRNKQHTQVGTRTALKKAPCVPAAPPKKFMPSQPSLYVTLLGDSPERADADTPASSVLCREQQVSGRGDPLRPEPSAERAAVRSTRTVQSHCTPPGLRPMGGSRGLPGGRRVERV